MAIDSLHLPLLEPIRGDIEQVDGLLRDAVAEVAGPLGAMLELAIGGGKRLRAALVILTAGLFAESRPFSAEAEFRLPSSEAEAPVKGGERSPASGEASPLPPFYDLAAAVEMLHAATLVHDDVVDQSSLRRGRETLHNRWPAGVSVLAGDYLLARATLWLAGLERPPIMQVFAQTVCTMVRGEIRQTLTTKGKHRNREEYCDSIEAKSASLFAAAMEMAGILAAAEQEHIAALRTYGREFGLAFQIVDDVLDLTGDEGRLGKPAGSDLRQGLITLPTLHYLAANPADTAVQAVLSGQRDDEHLHAAIMAIRSSGAVEASLDEARQHAGLAQEAVSGLPQAAAHQTLHALAGYVVQRRS